MNIIRQDSLLVVNFEDITLWRYNTAQGSKQLVHVHMLKVLFIQTLYFLFFSDKRITKSIFFFSSASMQLDSEIAIVRAIKSL